MITIFCRRAADIFGQMPGHADDAAAASAIFFAAAFAFRRFRRYF